MNSESRSVLVTGILMLASFQCIGFAIAAEIYRDPARPVDERVRDLLERMTLQEKIDQLSQKGADGIAMQDGRADEASLERLFGGRSIGALCVRFGDDLFESRGRLAAGQKYFREKTRLGIQALTVNEGLHGVLARGATIYPQFLALGCTWNPALARAMGSQISREASAAGINQLLTPMIEVIRDPRWGRVEECIGESPFLVSRMCSAASCTQGSSLLGGLPEYGSLTYIAVHQRQAGECCDKQASGWGRLSWICLDCVAVDIDTSVLAKAARL